MIKVYGIDTARYSSVNQSTSTNPNEVTDYIIIIILILLRQYSNKKFKIIQYSKPEIKSLQLKETY